MRKTTAFTAIVATLILAGCGNRQETAVNHNNDGGVLFKTAITISGPGVGAAGLFITEQNPSNPDYGNGVEPEPYWGMGDDTVCGYSGAIPMRQTGSGQLSANVEIERGTRNIINVVYCSSSTSTGGVWAAFGAGSTLRVRDGITVTVRPSADVSPTDIGSFLVTNGVGGANFSITISDDGTAVSFGGGSTTGGGGGGSGTSTVRIRYIGTLSSAPSIGGEFDSLMVWTEGYTRPMTPIAGGYEYVFTNVDLTQNISCAGATVSTQHICLTFNASGMPAGYAVNHTGITGSGTWQVIVDSHAPVPLTTAFLQNPVSSAPYNLQLGITSSGQVIDVKLSTP